ncbi:MAG: class I SAM-dependent methyltransferase [Calditrichia bacterium]|nr:class I SAM-dependent methyltransferase [Calditrichota bacterium]
MPDRVIRKLNLYKTYAVSWYEQRAYLKTLQKKSYDYETLFAILAELTGTTPEIISGYYQEMHDDKVFSLIESTIRNIPDLQHHTYDGYDVIQQIGIEKYVRIDRTALYCIVRAKKPEIFVETGTRWGIGACFILAAMEKNGGGHLYSFDIGINKIPGDEYFWPKNHQQLGFMVPQHLRHRYTIIEGDAKLTLPNFLSDIQPKVDIFYHDSLHTYEHMNFEFTTIRPHMAANGLLISEDTNHNDAWSDFIKQTPYKLETGYCSHLGIFEDREVRAIAL